MDIKKRGRKSKANPQKHRLMIRMNSKDHKQFLKMFEKSGTRSYSAFIADCILNKSLKVVVVNKSLIDFTVLLSSFHAQFWAIKNNFNQAYVALVKNFGEEKAFKMIQIVAQSTREFGLLKQKIEEVTNNFRELCLPK